MHPHGSPRLTRHRDQRPSVVLPSRQGRQVQDRHKGCPHRAPRLARPPVQRVFGKRHRHHRLQRSAGRLVPIDPHHPPVARVRLHRHHVCRFQPQRRQRVEGDRQPLAPALARQQPKRRCRRQSPTTDRRQIGIDAPRLAVRSHHHRSGLIVRRLVDEPNPRSTGAWLQRPRRRHRPALLRKGQVLQHQRGHGRSVLDQVQPPMPFGNFQTQSRRQRRNRITRPHRPINDIARDLALHRPDLERLCVQTAAQQDRRQQVPRLAAQPPVQPVPGRPSPGIGPDVGLGGKGRIGPRIPAPGVRCLQHRPAIDGRDGIVRRLPEMYQHGLQQPSLHPVVPRAD